MPFEVVIIRQVKDFTTSTVKNQFVVSCRVAAYNRQFDQFHDVEMADFNKAQIKDFIRNWFHEEPKSAQHCWKKLQETQPLLEMASVPLLLTLLCITYNRRRNFPVNRAELYEEAIDALLRDWDATREITRDEVYKHLTQNRVLKIHSRLAAFSLRCTFSERIDVTSKFRAHPFGETRSKGH